MRVPEHLKGLTGKDGKDLEEELEWEAINELLAPLEEMLSTSMTEPQKPIVFVLGPPRSGTTLTSQLLASTGAFAASTNLVARFWKAPGLGTRLLRALGLLDAETSFNSTRGRTSGANEPHEFGYFWSRWFDLGQDTHAVPADLLARIDVRSLQRSLAAMEHFARKPLMFKNNTWFTFQANWLATTFPTGVFVACARDPFFIAQSLYAQRAALGDVSRWWSVRPSTYPSLLALTPAQQVAAQAVDIQREMTKSLAFVPADRLIRVGYDRLCDSPREVVNEVFRACGRLGEFLPSNEPAPDRFTSTNQVRLDPAIVDQIRDAVTARLAQA